MTFALHIRGAGRATVQTITQARALAHYSALAAQAACWASKAADAEAARLDARDAEDDALASKADDAADELLTEGNELLAHIADDTPRGHKLTRYYKAWNGLQLREGLTCEEIIEACIWAPAGADLRHAMYVLRERLRGNVQKQMPGSVEKIARRMLADEVAV